MPLQCFKSLILKNSSLLAESTIVVDEMLEESGCGFEGAKVVGREQRQDVRERLPRQHLQVHEDLCGGFR